MPTAVPTLAELATLAHTRRCAVVATRRTRILLDDEARPLPFVGVRFGPSVDAVAARLGADPHALVAAVDRVGDAVIYDPALDRLETDGATITALDPARRALGLATRPCRRPIWALVNLVWLDRVLEAVLDAPLGDPPPWLAMRRLHPLVAPGPPSSPELMAHLTRGLDTSWAALRAGVIDGTVAWTPVTPSLAAWLDVGSFARQCFASLPDLDVVMADLHELLGPIDRRRLATALARP
ncbi:MAG: hypothetical protein AAF081_07805 [Actinomycetota bacterium]